MSLKPIGIGNFLIKKFPCKINHKMQKKILSKGGKGKKGCQNESRVAKPKEHDAYIYRRVND